MAIATWTSTNYTNSNFTWIGYQNGYSGSYRAIVGNGSYVSFNFTGTGLKVYGFKWSNGSPSNTVFIDGVAVTSFSTYASSNTDNALLFTIDGTLSAGEHCCYIVNNDYRGANLGSFYIESTGSFLPTNIFAPKGKYKTSVTDMQVGDAIICEYTAGALAVGVFSKLGTSTATRIVPNNSTSAVSGSFFFIHVGYDTKGRMKLIADRSLNALSWEKLNDLGIASADGALNIMQFTEDVPYNTYLRLPTGGIDSSDTNNEWDMIIVNSTLNGSITSGDKKIWNWGTYDKASTTVSGNAIQKTVRGYSTASYVSSIAPSSDTYGFRPVLIIEMAKSRIDNLTLSRGNFTNRAITVSGDLVDPQGDDIRYQIYVNGTQVYPTIVGDWSVINPSGTHIYNSIDISNFIVGTNTVEVKTKNSTMTTPFTNSATISLTNATASTINATINGYNVQYNWTQSANAEGYRLYKNGVLVTDINNPNILTYLSENTTEQAGDIVLKAYNIMGEVDSNILTIKTLPTAPIELTISQLPTGFKLDWTDGSTIENAYKISKRVDNGAWTQLTNSCTEATYTDIFSFMKGVLYEYKIVATNEIGDSAELTWGIKVLDSTTLSAVENANSINYSWTPVLGVDGYKLVITNLGVENVITTTDTNYVFNITDEVNLSVYVQCFANTIYGDLTSANSNALTYHNAPRHLVENIITDIITNADNYEVDVIFTDKSRLEDGFNVVYKVNDFEEETIVIPSTSKLTTDDMYITTITVPKAVEKLEIKIATFNDKGQTEYTAPITLMKAPNIVQAGYQNAINKVKIVWIKDTAIEDEYVVKYSIDGSIEQEIKIPTVVDTTIYSTLINLTNTQTITFKLYSYKNGYEGFESQTYTFNKASQIALEVPTDFTAGWKAGEDGVARYSWTDNSERAVGFKFIYSINGGLETTIDVPCSTITGVGETYNADIANLANGDLISGKVRAYSLVDESADTAWKEETYWEVEPVTPDGWYKERTEEGIILHWNPVDYVYNYEITYTIDGVQTVDTTENTSYFIETNESMKQISASMRAVYVGGNASEPTTKISFSPTKSEFSLQTTVHTPIDEKFDISMRTYTRNTRLDYDDFMKILKLNLIFDFSPINTSTLSYQTEERVGVLTMSIDHTKQNYDSTMWVSNKTIISSADFQESVQTNNIVFDGALVETASLEKGQIFNFEPILSIIKNKNIESQFTTSASIKNINLDFASQWIYTAYYSTVSTEITPVQSTIYTKYQVDVPIEVEIHKIRVATMGDSITAGHPGYWNESKTGNIQSTYQYWLQKRLGDDFEVINGGYGSDTTLKCLNRFDRDIVSKNPQYCIIQCGTNDNYIAQGNNATPEQLELIMNGAKDNIIAMVNKCRMNNIVPIIGTLLPRTTTKGIYRQNLWDFNKWIIEYSNSQDDVYYVDFYDAGKDNIPPTPLEEPGAPGNFNPLYDGDSVFDVYGNLVRRGYGVHPSVLGYKIMADAIPLSIFKALKTGIQIYLDPECTIEESTVNADKTNMNYIFSIRNITRGRIKNTSRYIKNIGNTPMIYALYIKNESGADIKFSTDGGGFKDNVSSRLDAGGINKIDIKIDVPQFGDAPNIDLEIATRSVKNKIIT